MQNQEVAHKFFYDTNGSFDRRSMTVSYYGNKYYSYGTVIGKIAENRQGQNILIVSAYNFSNTTAKHLGELKAANPYYDEYELPQRMGNSDFYAQDVVDSCISHINYYAGEKLTQKWNREQFIFYYNMLESTLEIAGFEPFDDKTNETLEQFKNLYNDLNNPEKIEEFKTKQRKKDKEKREKLQKELKELLESKSYIELIEFTFGDKWFNDYDLEEYNRQKELKSKLREYLNPKKELSFVWFDSESNQAKTSQGVRVDLKEAQTMLKLWYNGKLKHGMSISCYTVLEVMTNYVKIGCHKIPADNLKALYESITEKKVA